MSIDDAKCIGQFRPLTNEERASIEKRLLDARERKMIQDNYISDLEQQLRIGTTWMYETVAFGRMVKEVEEECEKFNQWLWSRGKPNSKTGI